MQSKQRMTLLDLKQLGVEMRTRGTKPPKINSFPVTCIAEQMAIEAPQLLNATRSFEPRQRDLVRQRFRRMSNNLVRTQLLELSWRSRVMGFIPWRQVSLGTAETMSLNLLSDSLLATAMRYVWEHEFDPCPDDLSAEPYIERGIPLEEVDLGLREACRLAANGHQFWLDEHIPRLELNSTFIEICYGWSLPPCIPR